MKTLLEHITEGFVREAPQGQKPPEERQAGTAWQTYEGDKATGLWAAKHEKTQEIRYGFRSQNAALQWAQSEPDSQDGETGTGTGADQSNRGGGDAQAGQQSVAQGTAAAATALGVGDTSPEDGETDSQVGTDQDNQDGDTSSQGIEKAVDVLQQSDELDWNSGLELDDETKEALRQTWSDGLTPYQKGFMKYNKDGTPKTHTVITSYKTVIKKGKGKDKGKDIEVTEADKVEEIPIGEEFAKMFDILYAPDDVISPEKKKELCDRFKEKYKPYSLQRSKGNQVYLYRESGGNGKGTNSKPISSNPNQASTAVVELFKKGGCPLQTDFQVSGGKLVSARNELLTSEVMRELPQISSDAIKIQDGKVTEFTVDGKTIKWIDPERATNERTRAIIEMYNQQLQSLSRLVDKEELSALVIESKGASQKVQELINKSIDELPDVPDEVKQAHADVVGRMGEAETVEEFDDLVREYYQVVTSHRVLDMSKSLLTESMAILRETKRNTTIVIPTASDFPVGDFVAMGSGRGAGRLPMLVEVSLDGESATHPDFSDMGIESISIKFGGGAESAQFGKILLHSYNSSSYGTGEEIKNRLLKLTESGEDTLYTELWNDKNPTGLEQFETELDDLYSHFGDLICKYHGVEPSEDNLSAIRQCFTYGRKPEANKDGTITPCDIENSLHRSKTNKGEAALRNCEEEQKQKWDAFNQMSAIVDVISNSHIATQSYSNLGFYASGTVKETTGGIDVSGKQNVCLSRGNPAKNVDKCKPQVSYPAGMVPTDIAELPSAKNPSLLEQEVQLSPRQQQLRNELKKLVRDIAINRLGDYGN
jgi:hypothetical protein